MTLIADGRLTESSRGPAMNVKSLAFGYCSIHDVLVIKLVNA